MYGQLHVEEEKKTPEILLILRGASYAGGGLAIVPQISRMHSDLDPSVCFQILCGGRENVNPTSRVVAAGFPVDI